MELGDLSMSKSNDDFLDAVRIISSDVSPTTIDGAARNNRLHFPSMNQPITCFESKFVQDDQNVEYDWDSLTTFEKKILRYRDYLHRHNVEDLIQKLTKNKTFQEDPGWQVAFRHIFKGNISLMKSMTLYAEDIMPDNEQTADEWINETNKTFSVRTTL